MPIDNLLSTIITLKIKFDFNVDVTQYIVGLRYIETFRRIALGAAKRTVHMPYETDVLGAAGTVGIAKKQS